MSARETLILFARPPQPGRTKTRLVPELGTEGAAALYRAFLLDMAATARAVRAARPSVGLAAEWALGPGKHLEDFPLGEWLPGPFLHRRQAGGDLGGRMAAALGRRLAWGGRAVLIGTDFPDLPARILLEAFEALAGGPSDPPAAPHAVLGPAEDGGYFLVGLERPEARAFGEMPWGSAGVFERTHERLEGLGYRVLSAGGWRDVDTPEDLAALRRRLAARPGAAPATHRALAGSATRS